MPAYYSFLNYTTTDRGCMDAATATTAKDLLVFSLNVPRTCKVAQACRVGTRLATPPRILPHARSCTRGVSGVSGNLDGAGCGTIYSQAVKGSRRRGDLH